ncbi:MAG TPA: cyclodeaminase/cyclohydrolase family protein [Pyrinomonadaceae bacterium]|nr:cyclodeaminase/cyclohydrolase family protein [Pyrinomonadaceae bacterium]
MDQQLILLPTTQLLEKFGAGNHVPGSGSAAAFSGILACKLSLTVIKLTKEKEDYAAVEPRMNFIETQIVNMLEPALFEAFQKDSDEFDKVIAVRLQRKQETDLKKRKQLGDQARELLRPATEVPVQICEVCHSVCQHALSLFDLGFQSARGDSGTAATLALAGANGALFTCYLNLKEFRSGDWAKETRRRCDELLQRSTDLQISLFSRVARLQEEGIEPTAIQLELKMD